jgi:hypothetical protein
MAPDTNSEISIGSGGSLNTTMQSLSLKYSEKIALAHTVSTLGTTELVASGISSGKDS